MTKNPKIVQENPIILLENPENLHQLKINNQKLNTNILKFSKKNESSFNKIKTKILIKNKVILKYTRNKFCDFFNLFSSFSNLYK